MKPVDLETIKGADALSHVLHLSLDALRLSPLQLTAVDMSRLLQISPSALARMRNLYRRPEYGKFVSHIVLRKLLVQLFDMFPTLCILDRSNGHRLVRLKKRHNGRRLTASKRGIKARPEPVCKKVRPGTTRWFLQQSA